MKSFFLGFFNFILILKNLCLVVIILVGSDFLINVLREFDWNVVDVYGYFLRC